MYPLKTLNDALYYLRQIYNPEVRGSRRRRRSHSIINNALCGVPDNALLREPHTLRTDTFERNYAIQWLTALISQLVNEHSDPDPSLEHPGDVQFSQPSTEELMQNAASLLAICAGTASAGVTVRQFVFENGHSSEDDTDLIKIELVDAPLDNHDYRSVGAQTWGSACILADMIVEHPNQFGFHPHHLYKRDDVEYLTFRCLELGAGTGLVSLTVAKMMQRSVFSTKTSTQLEVVATDYYPSVLINLKRNIASNCPESSSPSVRILTQALDWSTFSSEATHSPVFETPFDLILGADIVYELQHALWIKSCLTKLLRNTFSTTLPDIISPTFHLIIPLRATHTSESNTIEQLFPFNDHNRSNSNGSTELVINHKEIITCDAESGKEGEDVEYVYYKIGWSVP